MKQKLENCELITELLDEKIGMDDENIKAMEPNVEEARMHKNIIVFEWKEAHITIKLDVDALADNMAYKNLLDSQPKKDRTIVFK